MFHFQFRRSQVDRLLFFSHPTTLESTVACTTYGCPLDDGKVSGMAAGTRASEQFGDIRVVLAKLSCETVEG